MRYLVGVVLGIACISTLWADRSSERVVPRTPSGMIWAGTTFTLQASAQMNNQQVAVSDPSTVRVGQLRQWQANALNGNLIHLPSGEYLYQIRLENTGNGTDQFQFTVLQRELTEPRWSLALFEDRNGTGSTSGNPQIAVPGTTGTGSVLDPGQGMTYLLRVRPPSSSIPTDGMWAQVHAGLVGTTNLQLVGDTVVAGTLRTVWASGRGWSYGGQQTRVTPVIWMNRIFWMGTDSNNVTRIHHAPLNTATESSPFGERVTYSRQLTNFVPSGFSEVFGTSWFVGTQNGELVRIPLQLVLDNNSSVNPIQPVVLPGGAQIRLDLQPFQLNNRLYVIGTDNRLHALREDGSWLGQSMRLSPTLGNISCSPVVLMKRYAVLGTDQGWVVFVDMLSGNIQLTRRVDTQKPIRHLAVNRDGRLLLTVAGDDRVMGINARQGTVQWSRTIDKQMGEIVSNLVYDRESDSVFLMTSLGNLFGIHASTGLTRPLYPQQVLDAGVQRLTRATLEIARRQGRPASYIYVLAQQQTGETSTQGRLVMVTLQNPLNRAQVTEGSMYIGSEYLPNIMVLGNHCLFTGITSTERNQGHVSAITLR